jgi:predicted negative regulator of RcsB-dependent stress response
MEEQTDRTRVRQAFAQNKRAVTIYALLAVVALIGWLTSLPG